VLDPQCGLTCIICVREIKACPSSSIVLYSCAACSSIHPERGCFYQSAPATAREFAMASSLTYTGLTVCSYAVERSVSWLED